MAIIKKNVRTFNQELWGHYGEFGKGGNAQIFFIQTVITPKDLDKISLVSDIEGSEKWAVKDLFQRDVDTERVTKGLQPYLLDQDTIKFFNPLTLTFIPSELGNNKHVQEIPIIEPEEKIIDDHNWSCIEQLNEFQYRHVVNQPESACVEWDDRKTKIVAIDGQHRLSALKNIKDDVEGRRGVDFDSWAIPVVLFGVRALPDADSINHRTLDVIRRTFVYINTEAKAPSQTRQILLNDSEVNEICTQEFLDYFHQNDCLEPDDRNESILPLIVFDWRGHQEGGRNRQSAGSLKNIEEIRHWFQYYILGENWSKEQQKMLGIEPVGDTQSLKFCFQENRIKPESIKQLREQFTKLVLPGFVVFLNEFLPYKKYGNQLREIESEYTLKSTEARHAFHKLRFGEVVAAKASEPEIASVLLNIKQDIEAAEDELIPDILKKDIGMRGVLFAYSDLYNNFYKRQSDVDSDFLEYSKWCVEKLNSLFADGWFEKKNKKARRALHQVCYDHNEGIINYRHDRAGIALGAVICMVISAKIKDVEDVSEDLFQDYYSNHRDRLKDTLMAGYKKEVRPSVKDKLPEDILTKDLNKAVKEAAEKLVEGHLTWLDKELSVY